MFQWLGLGSFPGWGTKILQAMWCCQKKKIIFKEKMCLPLQNDPNSNLMSETHKTNDNGFIQHDYMVQFNSSNGILFYCNFVPEHYIIKVKY